MATFWEIAARSVSNLFSLYFVYLSYLFIYRFDFKSGICLLIAPVPVHCFSITFLYLYLYVHVFAGYPVLKSPLISTRCKYHFYLSAKEGVMLHLVKLKVITLMGPSRKYTIQPNLYNANVLYSQFCEISISFWKSLTNID